MSCLSVSFSIHSKELKEDFSFITDTLIARTLTMNFSKRCSRRVFRSRIYGTVGQGHGDRWQRVKIGEFTLPGSWVIEYAGGGTSK